MDISTRGASVSRPQRAAPADTAVPWPPQEVSQTPASRFERVVACIPDRIAVSSPSGKLTYTALNGAANRIAAAVLADGKAGNEPVALLFAETADTIAGMLGALKTGRPYVVLDPSFPVKRLAYRLEDAGANLIVTDDTSTDLACVLADGERQVIRTGDLERLGGDGNPRVETLPEATAFVVYTSGSTGTDKAIAKSNRNIMLTTREIARGTHVSCEDHIALLYSCSWAAGAERMYSAVLNGSSVHPYEVRTRGLVDFEEWLRDEEITKCELTPSLLRSLPGIFSGRTRLPRLKLLGTTGEQARRADFEVFREAFADDCVFMNTLGMSEAGPMRRFYVGRRDVIEESLIPAGYPVEGIEVLVTDEEGREARPGEVGEIVLKSANLAQGYWRRPELTRKAFREAPEGGGVRLFRTGDIGRMAADGCLMHLGRADHQMKVRGFRVSPAEVESALMDVKGVSEVAVAAKEIRPGDARLVAYVVGDEGLELAPGPMRAELAETLPDFMIPAAYHRLEQMPKTVTGKVDRQALPEPEIARRNSPTRTVEFGDDLVRALLTIWEDELGVSPIGLSESFLDLGGHSLLAARIFARIEKEIGTRLPLAAILQAPTIESLAEVIRKKGWQPLWRSLVPVRTGGTKRPFFFIHGIHGNVVGQAELARRLGPDQPYYGLQAVGLSGEVPPLLTVEEMARHYLAEMRTVQPKGPYRLGGMCFGGMVAYEMARQLAAAGGEVELLALLDPPPPRGMQLSAAGRLLVRLKRTRLRVRMVCRRLKSALRGEGADYPSVRRVNRRARREYVPRSYSGNAVFFAFTEHGGEEPGRRERAEAWSRLVRGDFRIHVLEGHHDHMLMEPYVDVIAERLRKGLDAAQ